MKTMNRKMAVPWYSFDLRKNTVRTRYIMVEDNTIVNTTPKEEILTLYVLNFSEWT